MIACLCCRDKFWTCGRRHVHEEVERRVRRAETRAADAEALVHRAESEAAELRTAASTAGHKAEDQSAAAQRLQGQVETLKADADAARSSHHRQLRVRKCHVPYVVTC